MKFDLLVIGAGPGGYPAAVTAAEAGLKVAIVDKSGALGGTCLSVGCIPSKTLLHFTERYAEMSHKPFTTGTLNFQELQQHREKVIQDLQKSLTGLFKQLKIAVYHGEAEFVSETQVQVGGELLEAGKIVLATGSEPISLPFLPIDEQQILSSTGALSLGEPPKSMAVIGAGVIGVELASVFQRLGTKVQVVELLPTVCTGIDHDLSRALQKSLTAQGLEFFLSTALHKAEKLDGKVQLFLKQADGKESMITADKVLVAVGRRPNSKIKGLDKAGITVLPSGHIMVDQKLQTTSAHVYAIGDLIQGPMLAHRAEAEGRALGAFFGGAPFEEVNYFALPSVIYTYPEVASVGLTEAEVKAFERPYKATKSSFQANPRAIASGTNEGFVKMIWDIQTRTLLGAHIIGPCASELIAIGMMAIAKKMTAKDIATLPFAHPTLSEAIKDCSNIPLT